MNQQGIGTDTQKLRNEHTRNTRKDFLYALNVENRLKQIIATKLMTNTYARTAWIVIDIGLKI